MANTKQNLVAERVRQYAEKLAANGAPDRMTTADGQGGITAHKGSIPVDPSEAALKSEQPADGKAQQAAALPGSGPDRMTTADGQGGITAQKDSVPADPGEGEIKVNQPADGISKRATNLRNALAAASPRFAEQLGKQATNTPAPAPQLQREAAPASPGIALSTDTLAKIASVVLSTDAGIRFVHDTLEKQAGEDAARAQIREAIEAAQTFDYTEQVKSAAFDEVAVKAEVIYHGLAEAGLTEQDAADILKEAAEIQDELHSFDHPLLKQAFAQGMDDAALLTAAEEGAGEEGVPPVDEALPMGGESLGEEEILALLQEMIASGEITEDDIMQALAVTGEGAEAPAEAELAPA